MTSEGPVPLTVDAALIGERVKDCREESRSIMLLSTPERLALVLPLCAATASLPVCL